MAIIHYLVHGTWLGVLALVLIVIGLTSILFARISIHQNHGFGGSDVGFSHKVIGLAFILAGLIVIAFTIYFGHQPITSTEYANLDAEIQKIPELKPALQTYISEHPKMTRIDYQNWQLEFESLKNQLYVQKISSE